MSEYKNPVCRGSFMLGTACGTCERCLEQLIPKNSEELISKIDRLETELKYLLSKREKTAALVNSFLERKPLSKNHINKKDLRRILMELGL